MSAQLMHSTSAACQMSQVARAQVFGLTKARTGSGWLASQQQRFAGPPSVAATPSSKPSLTCSAFGERRDQAAVLTEERDGKSSSDAAVDSAMAGMSFQELCDEFECVSSPAVEVTARQLARDIVEVREGKQRALRCYATAVEYSDPLCSFQGRERYQRPSWIASAVVNPEIALERMYMASQSTLVIVWRCEGALKAPLIPLRPSVLIRFTSSFTLNLISGQVTEHREQWDTSLSSPPIAALFLASRAAWASRQLSLNMVERAASVQSFMQGDGKGGDNSTVYADPTDPRKFFQQSDPNSDLYQIAFFVAFMYLVVRVLQYLV